MLSPDCESTLAELAVKHQEALGDDAQAYLGHVRRVLHFYELLRGEPADALDAIAGFFHDLGIWTDRTNDYLPPSMREARAYLDDIGQSAAAELVVTMIDEHHKLRAYTGPHADRAEPFRRADLVDFSFGIYTAGLPRAELRRTFAELPPGAFRRFLLGLAGKWLVRYPSRPFPIFKW